MTTLDTPVSSIPSPESHPPFAARLAQRTSARLRTRTASVIGLASLIGASLLLVGAQVALVKQRSVAARAQAAWSAAKQLETGRAAEMRRRLAIETLMKEAAMTDLSVQSWDERRFGIRQASMTRKAANRLLGEIARARGQIFAAEQFELSVKEPQDGLFTSPAAPDSDLIVSLRGSLLYRAKAGSK
ncbi:MAG: hypothetical protein ACRYGA_14320 [Janthinobacterium lividum]